MAGWQMAPYDLSSVAYSDSHSGSGSYSEIVPYSPLGVGFERKERHFVVASRARLPPRRLGAPPLSPDGLVSWHGLRIVRRKVAMRAGNSHRVRAAGSASSPRLLGNGGSISCPRSPKKGGGNGAAAAALAAKPAALGARQRMMLPRELTELLQVAPSGSARAGDPLKLAGVMDLRSTQEAETLAQALLQLADRFKACIDDVHHSVRDRPRHVARAPVAAPASRLSALADVEISGGEGGGGGSSQNDAQAAACNGGSWLAETMSWLRGGNRATPAAAQGEQAHGGQAGGPANSAPAVAAADAEHDVDMLGGADSGGAAGVAVGAPPADDVSAAIWRAVERAVLHGCEQVQARLSRRVDAHIFLVPVDPERDQCPDYRNIIAHPMDLGTVAARLAARAYSSERACSSAAGLGGHMWFADAKLVFDNAMVYNPAAHPVHRQARKLLAAFADAYVALLAKIEARLRRFGSSEVRLHLARRCCSPTAGAPPKRGLHPPPRQLLLAPPNPDPAPWMVV
jgi:hypothetical protein